MTLAVLAALVLSAVGAVLCGLAIRALWRRQAARARRLAAYSFVASVSFLPIISLTGFLSAVFSAGPESKAYYLARGISEALNVGVLNLPLGMASFVAWIVARRREAAITD